MPRNTLPLPASVRSTLAVFLVLATLICYTLSSPTSHQAARGSSFLLEGDEEAMESSSLFPGCCFPLYDTTGMYYEMSFLGRPPGSDSYAPGSRRFYGFNEYYKTLNFDSTGAPKQMVLFRPDLNMTFTVNGAGKDSHCTMTRWSDTTSSANPSRPSELGLDHSTGCLTLDLLALDLARRQPNPSVEQVPKFHPTFSEAAKSFGIGHYLSTFELSFDTVGSRPFSVLYSFEKGASDTCAPVAIESEGTQPNGEDGDDWPVHSVRYENIKRGAIDMQEFEIPDVCSLLGGGIQAER